ncbi:MAG: hypothetical protein HQL08_00575 [Nitrospirae bacterium]|nr:hypothetical protein [Nitrospirota bacterium]
MMRLTVITSMIVVMSIVDVCHAVDPELNARLGIPVQPQSSGETFNQGLIGSMGLGGCGDLGITNQLNSLISLGQQAISNLGNNIGTIAATAAIAYFMPTEYSVVSNLLSDARKYLAVLADKCKTYQAARNYMEKSDIAGIRKAAFARCMEQNGGDDFLCSKPANAWQYLFGTTGCVSALDKALNGVTLPSGTISSTIKSFFGDVQICPDGSGRTPATLTADKVYQANMLFYGPAVTSGVSTAQTRYLAQSDIQSMNLCIGPANNGNAGNGGGNAGSGGVICPHAETINMVASFPSDEQAVFTNKLVESLSLLQTVYNTYSWSSMLNKAAAASNAPVPDALTTPINQMTEQKEKELNDLVKLKVQSSGNGGDLSQWEKQVMERNSYWQQLKASQGNETNYGSQIFGSSDSSTNDSQSIIDSIKNSYLTP